MKSDLSISRAWEETKARLAADGRLLTTVALAMIALPSAIAQFASPSAGFGQAPQSLGTGVMMLAVWLIGLIGQLALVRLAIGPSVTVGEAIAHGARRMPAYLGAILLLVFGLVILAIPGVVALAAGGVSFEPGAAPPSGGAVILLILGMILVLFVAVRMLLMSPVASAEQAGPIAIIRRSWQLTAGHFWRLLGFVLLFIIGVIIAVGAVSIVMTLIATLLFGSIEPLTVSALIVALVEALASAIATALFIVMIARIYVQLDGGSAAEASVPSSGT